MTGLVFIALKSLFVAGVTLGLLQLMRRRSAAERSWVAHIGLLALMIVAIAPLALPRWTIEAPAVLGSAPTAQLPVTTPFQADSISAATKAPAAMPAASKTVAQAPSQPKLSPLATAIAIYAVPAAILLLITCLAMARLVVLRARADVLVDGHWLSALARAQRRMGFKHGTALLTSNELASPISWGLMRPVILLNTRAVEASDEAEAIIAHELAHVARMDWIKLLLARFATALFWFNPLVWLLAREAHQLREEAADDAVLAADISDTDYAQLLVGVARHECPGLLLGAHGVAPSKKSLARRVARVLDGKLVRRPAAGPFALGVFTGAVLIAAPLAALTLTPAGIKEARSGGSRPAPAQASSITSATPTGQLPPYYSANPVPTDLPSIIGEGVATSVQSAVAAINPRVNVAVADGQNFEAVSSNGASVRSANGVTTSRAPNGATVIVYPPDARGRSKVIARAPNGATITSYADAADEIPGFDREHGRKGAIDRAIEMKAVGVTSEYTASVMAASSALRDADPDDLVGMKAVGVTPEYIRDLGAAGLGNLDADDLTQARAVGVTCDYVRAMRAAGFGRTLDDFVQMRAVNVTPGYAEQFRKAGYKIKNAEKLIELKAQDIDLDALRNSPPP